MTVKLTDFNDRPTACLQIAAGCFGLDGFGEGLDHNRDLVALDALVLKTTTLKPLAPRQKPRFEKLADGNYWNYVGLRNPGIEALESLLVSRSLESWPNLWLSLYAESTADYLTLIGRADQISCLVGYEINLSCPNLGSGKLVARPDIGRLINATSRPLRFKLSLTGNHQDPAKLDLDGIRSVVIGNSLPYRAGGLSGPILRDRYRNLIVGLRARDAGLEIVACGGVESRLDILDYLRSGADKVQIGAYFRAHGSLPADLR